MTGRAQAVLLPPDSIHLRSSQRRFEHFLAPAELEILIPIGSVRVGGGLDLDVPHDRRRAPLHSALKLSVVGVRCYSHACGIGGVHPFAALCLSAIAWRPLSLRDEHVIANG